MQQVYVGDSGYLKLKDWVKDKKAMVVCGSSYKHMEKTRQELDDHGFVYFSEYEPNPKYESVMKGTALFNEKKCDSIIAVGGGSAMDVAKCIKLYSDAETVPFLAIPTTAGTGSEATRFAVIYKNGEKQSITDEALLPDVVILDADNLNSLPEYQRKATMLDTLAHSIESMWSVNSTEQSRDYSRKAIELFNKHMAGYLENTKEGNEEMQMAAYNAGCAINITQTTAGHAMCYKITGLYGIAHGQAAMLCNLKLLPWMYDNIDKCIDSRGVEYLKEIFEELAGMFDCVDVLQLVKRLNSIYEMLELETPRANEEEIKFMTDSVNPVRLKNNPIMPDKNDIETMYRKIFRC